MNLFKFNGTIFYEYLKNCPFNEARNEKELPTAVLNLAKSISKSILGIAHAEHVPDLTSKKDIEILSKIIESNYFKKWYSQGSSEFFLSDIILSLFKLFKVSLNSVFISWDSSDRLATKYIESLFLVLL